MTVGLPKGDADTHDTYHYIDTDSALSQLISRMSSVSVRFVDTEFIKRNTFYPILGLLQINLIMEHEENVFNGGEVYSYLIDAVNLDLTEFWTALFAADSQADAPSTPTLVMHACSEDVDLMSLEANNSRLPDVFDTQIGLSFLGHGLQKSYQDALNDLLDVQIDKGESCSDWLARPLRAEQMSYAANDVVYLPHLYQQVVSQLQEKGLYDYALEDSQSLCTDVLSKPTDDTIYLEWADFRYTPKQLAQLKALCEWREGVARQHNKPRTFIIKKTSLRDLLHKQPQNKAELSRIKDFRHANVRQFGDDILSCLHDLPDQSLWPMRVARPFKEPKTLDLSQRIKALVAEKAALCAVPADVLMRKRWINQLYKQVAFASNEPLSPYLSGWRKDVVTQPIIDMLMAYQPLLREQMVPREQQSGN